MQTYPACKELTKAVTKMYVMGVGVDSKLLKRKFHQVSHGNVNALSMYD